MMAPLVLALALGQSMDPYVRSRVEPGNLNTHCLFWAAPTVTWQLSKLGNPVSSEAQRLNEFEAIRRSFQSWQGVFASCGNLSLVEGPMVDDRAIGYELNGTNRNIILFRARQCREVVPTDDACWREESCGNVYDCWDGHASTIGLTLTTYDEKSGIIYDSDIQLNSSRFTFTTVDGAPCTSGSTVNCVSTDVQNTMTHEIGHFIGLDHTLASGSTMNPSAPPGETSKRLIDTGSRDFVCAVYPKGRPSQSCFTPSVSPGAVAVLGQPAFGCASAGVGAWAPALLGWSLLLLYRRRRDGGGGR